MDIETEKKSKFKFSHPFIALGVLNLLVLVLVAGYFVVAGTFQKPKAEEKKTENSEKTLAENTKFMQETEVTAPAPAGTNPPAASNNSRSNSTPPQTPPASTPYVPPVITPPEPYKMPQQTCENLAKSAADIASAQLSSLKQRLES